MKCFLNGLFFAIGFVLLLLLFSMCQGDLVDYLREVKSVVFDFSEIREMSNEERLIFDNLLQAKVIVSSDTFITVIIDYYNTIIAIMATMMALLGGGAYMYIKSSTEDKARAEIRKLLDTEDNAGYVEDALNDILEAKGSSYLEAITITEKRYAKVDSRLEFLEKQLASVQSVKPTGSITSEAKKSTITPKKVAKVATKVKAKTKGRRKGEKNGDS